MGSPGVWEPSLGDHEQACPISWPQCPHWSTVLASQARVVTDVRTLQVNVWLSPEMRRLCCPVCRRDPAAGTPAACRAAAPTGARAAHPFLALTLHAWRPPPPWHATRVCPRPTGQPALRETPPHCPQTHVRPVSKALCCPPTSLLELGTGHEGREGKGTHHVLGLQLLGVGDTKSSV